MKITLVATHQDLADAWTKYCGDLANVSVYQGSILDIACDAVVSPANSFGFMDGGIDLIYSQHFGWTVQERLQHLIRTKHYGELLVGTAEIVETENEAIPYLIAAPTMRVPMILKDSINPYLAARAVLLLIQQGYFESGVLAGEKISDVIQTVAFPGLATGIGKVPVEICARQMRTAIDTVFSPTFPRSWSEAQFQHQQLYSDAARELQ